MQTVQDMTAVKTVISKMNLEVFHKIASFDHSTRLYKDNKKYSLIEVQLKGLLLLEHDDNKQLQIRRYVSYSALEDYQVC